MGNEIGSYDTDPIISGDEKVIGSNDNGDTANYSIRDIAAYAQTDGTGRIAIFDGATDIAEYRLTTIVVDDAPLRFGLSGSLTDIRFFPSKYGEMFVNWLSPPNKSAFDFRFLPLGLFIEFDLEFDVECTLSNGNPISALDSYSFDVVAEYPNLTVERQTIVLKVVNEQGPAGVLMHHVKLRFSTYIKEVLTDSLLGGGFEIQPVSKTGGATDLYEITNLKVTARI